MTRLLEHTKQVSCSKVICKHCEQDFNFKNKLHEHIREQHTQKSNINSNLRFSTSESTYKIEKKSTVICSLASSASSASSISFATLTSISESISSKCSNLSIATLNITSKSMKKLSVNSLTFSTSSSRTSVSKHQKSYLIIDDLIRMFDEKIKSFDLRQHQKRFASSQSSDTRSFDQSRSLYQSRIIVYFMSIINQKTSISQISKSSNSKSFQQHTSAKSIRFASVLSKKSTFSSYKKSDIFYISRQSRFSLRFSFV